jgi:acyl-CoA dehydrogenase
MNFSIPPATETLLAKIRDFMEREVYPLEEEARGRVREMGLWAPQVPTEYGGLGLGFMEHALVCEELGRSPYGMFVFSAQAPDAGNMEILNQFDPTAPAAVYPPLRKG